MTKQPIISFFHLLFTLSCIISGVKGWNENYNGSNSLFVFGDSYVDTGNWKKSPTGAWQDPYGTTFPGKPTGRFSDGRVLTDYIASYLNIRSPIPYKLRKYVKNSYFRYGMNFAYGGTGVFDTLVKEPNMTVQIDYFQRLVEKQVMGEEYLNSSIALVSVAGNDYLEYVAKNGYDFKNLSDFTTSIINQLAINLKRIHGLGVQKIAVATIEPVGCLPMVTAFSSYKNCTQDWNLAAKFHNEILGEAMEKLNNQTNTKSAFVTLNLYDAFISALKKSKGQSGSLKLNDDNLLVPCCEGFSTGSNKYWCGSVNASGAKQYSLCKSPENSFFWDSIHPSQNGWHLVYLGIQSSLQNLI